MDLYVFTSKTLANIWTGHNARLWAVPLLGYQEKSIRTKASNMAVGSRGVLWCSGTHRLTTPFVVRSRADQHRVVEGVWPGRWALPFAIEPLGDPGRQMSRDTIMQVLEVARSSGRSNLSHILPISAPTVFSPKEISEADWTSLTDHLGYATS